MFKKYMSGISAFALLAVIVMLAGTHSTVGYVSCNYCQVKEIAEIQSNSLDKIVVDENKKAAMVIADNAVFVDKTKKDKAIEASFVESTNQVKAYAEKEKSNIVDNSADIELANSVFARFDQTKRSYELAANSLVNDGIAGIRGREAGVDNESVACGYGGSVSETAIESGKFVCGACRRSENPTAAG